MIQMIGRLLLGLCVAGLLQAPMVQAATYGLVIGINDYQHKDKLAGAVNDAHAIANALRALGARDVIVLLDRQASRHNIVQAWQRLVRQSQADDILVLTFAGHGAQEPERVPGSEADGKDEALVLADFHERARNTERIVDDELHAWLQAAAPRRILFVADTCYAGTLTRAVQWPVRTRALTDYGPIVQDQLPAPKPQDAHLSAPDLPHVTFFAASREDEKAPEIRLDGQMHGALSWAFARALRGAADSNADGVLSKDEIAHFVLTNVPMYAEYRQHPEVRPTTPSTMPLLTLPAPLSAATLLSGATTQAPLRLFITGAEPRRLAEWQQQLRPQEVVNEPGTADLIWQVQQATVLSSLGDVVAYLPDNAPQDVRRVLEKWRTLRTIYSLSERVALPMHVLPHDGIHRQGTQVSVGFSGHHYAYMTLLNLSADGTVQLLYPTTPRHALQIPLGQPFQLDHLAIIPPFGAEHLIALLSPQPFPNLHRAIQALQGQPGAQRLDATLRQHLQDTAYQMGVVALYSAPLSK